MRSRVQLRQDDPLVTRLVARQGPLPESAWTEAHQLHRQGSPWTAMAGGELLREALTAAQDGLRREVGSGDMGRHGGRSFHVHVA